MQTCSCVLQPRGACICLIPAYPAVFPNEIILKFNLQMASLLLEAARLAQTAVVKQLLAEGADVDAADDTDAELW